MKIIFFLIDMNVGGTEKSFLNLISCLPKSYKIDVLFLKKRGGFLKEISDTIRVFEIDHTLLIDRFINKGPKAYIFHLLKNFKILKASYSLFNYLRWKLTGNFSYNYKSIDEYLPKLNIEYDIAIAYAGPHDFITYFTIEKIKAKKKMQWIHFDVLKIHLNKIFAKKYYSKFDQINCVSENSKKEMQLLSPIIKDKIHIFPNIVLKEEIRALANLENSFNDNFDGTRIVTLGRLYTEKGQQLIPDVVRKLKEDNYNFKWYCIGEGNLRVVLEEAIEKYGLEDNLTLLGLKINPYPYLKDTDIYVQTSLHEGYGLTLHEAKLFEKPIVTTAFSTAKEQIIHNETGLIVPISSEGLYRGIKQLLDNKNLQNKFISNLHKELENTKINKIEL